MENDYAGISEDQVLHQIFIDEQFPVEDVAAKAKEEKKKLAGAKAAIGYDYNEVGIRLPFFCMTSVKSIAASREREFRIFNHFLFTSLIRSALLWGTGLQLIYLIWFVGPICTIPRVTLADADELAVIFLLHIPLPPLFFPVPSS